MVGTFRPGLTIAFRWVISSPEVVSSNVPVHPNVIWALSSNGLIFQGRRDVHRAKQTTTTSKAPLIITSPVCTIVEAQQCQ